MGMGCKVVRNRHGNLTFRIHFRGTRMWEGAKAWRDTPEHRKLMEAKATLIAAEIEAGTFDYLAHFPQGNKAHLFRAEKEKAARQTIRRRYESWIEENSPPLVRRSRHRKYKSHFAAHILPRYGDTYPEDFGFADIRDLRNALARSKGLTIKSAKNVINATLRAFFRDLVAEGVLARSPFVDVPRRWWPATVVPTPDPFTEEERDEVLAYFDRKYKGKWPQGAAFLFTLFWTGARPSELPPRRWQDYNPRTGQLRVFSSRTEGEEGNTKTAGSSRSIRLLAAVQSRLEEIRPLHHGPQDYVFKNQAGSPIDQKEFATRHFWVALRVLNIRHRDMYAARHTFISVMLKYGYHPKQIADYCGNSPAMIYRHYAQWLGTEEEFGERAVRTGDPTGDLRENCR